MRTAICPCLILGQPSNWQGQVVLLADHAVDLFHDIPRRVQVCLEEPLAELRISSKIPSDYTHPKNLNFQGRHVFESSRKKRILGLDIGTRKPLRGWALSALR